MNESSTRTDHGGPIIRRSPDKACDNLLPLALLLTAVTFVTQWRWYWRYLRYGDDT